MMMEALASPHAELLAFCGEFFSTLCGVLNGFVGKFEGDVLLLTRNEKEIFWWKIETNEKKNLLNVKTWNWKYVSIEIIFQIQN